MRRLTFRDPFPLRIRRSHALVDARVLRRDSLPGSPQSIVRFTVITLIQEKGNTRKHPVRHERSLRKKGILHIWAG